MRRYSSAFPALLDAGLTSSTDSKLFAADSSRRSDVQCVHENTYAVNPIALNTGEGAYRGTLFVPKRRLAGTRNLILFSTYAFSYDGSTENSLQSDKILFSYQFIATTVPYNRPCIFCSEPYLRLILEKTPRSANPKISELKISKPKNQQTLDYQTLNY